jgi:hypothetical protein
VESQGFRVAAGGGFRSSKLEIQSKRLTPRGHASVTREIAEVRRGQVSRTVAADEGVADDLAPIPIHHDGAAGRRSAR